MTPSNDHENILHHNKEVIDQFIAWKSETKKLFKEKKEVKEDIITVLKRLAESILIPYFAKDERK